MTNLIAVNDFNGWLIYLFNPYLNFSIFITSSNRSHVLIYKFSKNTICLVRRWKRKNAINKKQFWNYNMTVTIGVLSVVLLCFGVMACTSGCKYSDQNAHGNS